MINCMKYVQIQDYKKKNFSKNMTAKYLNIDYKTVDKYWNMDHNEFAESEKKSKSRRKKADKYKSYVLEVLQKYPDISSAQLYDWIKERYNLNELDFNKRSFRGYVDSLRKEYNIPKQKEPRQYEAVEELPPGYQAQVDMGEIWLNTSWGKKKKVYCFGMVLAHSRYKFILWDDKPYTTASFIQAHIKAFEFFGGRPKQIVYDQDKILAVSENDGDIIYTEGFQNYVNELNFEVYLCRGADPESKGKIENVVKYAKHGFAEHRIYNDIESFNLDCLAWLKRTANAEEHGTTKKIPAEVFALEKEYLVPVSNHNNYDSNRSITYQVRKDNLVVYKGNRYRVPRGTYAPGKKVYMILNNGRISITDAETGEIYAEYQECLEKGKLIGTKSAPRDKSKTYEEIESSILKYLQNDEPVREFLKQVHSDKRRYYRDQLGVMMKICDAFTPDEINNGIAYCMDKELYSAVELRSTIKYLKQISEESEHNTTIESVLPERYRGNHVELRDLSIYEQAMERSILNGFTK